MFGMLRRCPAAAAVGVIAALVVLQWPQPAEAVPVGSCSVTGYTAATGAEASALRSRLREQPVQQRDGQRLDRLDTWVVPSSGERIVVVDTAEPMVRGDAKAVLFGIEFPIISGAGEPRTQYVSSTTMPHLGPTVRTVGIRASSNVCSREMVLVVDRDPLGTLAGKTSVALGVLASVLTIFLARRRSGSWLRRALLAAPFGLLAGVGEAVALQEAGFISPFSRAGWWGPVVGLAVALLLPLTRFGRRSTERSTAEADAAPLPVVGAYRATGVFGDTAVARLYTAVGADDERVLLKVVRPELAADATARRRLDREVETLSGLDHPNCVRLRTSLLDPPPTTPGTPTNAGSAGSAVAPVIVFEPVDGATARRVLDEHGPLTGPQALNVVAGVVSGLAAVHARGLVHRDVRPDNVYLSADGRVLLGNFEVAAPGADNAVDAEAVPPYASPAQRRGEAVAGDADLWSCGVLLGELLTGDVPVRAEGELLLPPSYDQLPAPMVALVSRAVAADPDERPRSTDDFLSALNEAAVAAYGPDWMTLGAITGTVIVPGGIIAVAAATGGAVAAGTTGTISSLVPVGVGGVGGAAGLGGPSAAASGQTASATPAAVKISTALTPVAAVAAVGVLALTVLANPQPASASTEVITPEAARVIFLGTLAEARAKTETHLADDVKGIFTEMLKELGAASGALEGVTVGVPRGQRAYPAHFFAYAQIRLSNGGTVHLFAKFERSAADKPWLMVSLNFSTDAGVIVPPLLDGDGYLAPSPADLLVDPNALAQRYVEWVGRAAASNAVGTDPVMTVREGAGSMLHQVATDANFDKTRGSPAFIDYTAKSGDLRSDRVPLSDATVLFVFSATVHQTIYNGSGRGVLLPCSQWYLFRKNAPSVHYKQVDTDFVLQVEARVPVKNLTGPASGAAPSVSATAAPTPTPTAGPGGGSGEARKVRLDDWNWRGENFKGIPC